MMALTQTKDINMENSRYKFRAWDAEREQMFTHPKWVEFRAKHGVITAHNYNRASNDQTLELMQYTGLTDKNGVEIYEGDVLKVVSKITSEIVVVTYFMGNACYSFLKHLETGTALYPTLITMTKEIIGNIRENPELLENNNEST